jgi:hypothetical protein
MSLVICGIENCLNERVCLRVCMPFISLFFFGRGAASEKIGKAECEVGAALN